MSYKFLSALALCAVCFSAPLTLSSCGDDDPTPPSGNNSGNNEGNNGGDNNDNGNNNEETVVFAKGADVSWLTEIEEKGFKYYDKDGKEIECMRLLRDECGMNSIRLRVWVNPENKWNTIDDVMVKARRANALGMRLMIDFHLSNTWADPGKQFVPAAWENKNPEQMAQAIKDHITDMLSRLKKENITPEWVQVGNETTNGMLWESGKVAGSKVNEFVRYFNAGYDAVKNLFPKAKVVLHIDNGWDQSLYNWFFNLMRANKCNYDLIGMSLYPEIESGSGSNWTVGTDVGKVNTCMANIRALNSRFGKPVIISEIGFHYTNDAGAKNAITTILDTFRGDNRLHGIFWWEPETPVEFNDYPKGAFVNGRPTIALDPFKN
jgi:arabinogalactan endo-1,4-beta-galactosidase